MWAGLGAARAILVEAVWGERKDENNQHTTVTEWLVRMDGCEEGMVPMLPGKPHPQIPVPKTPVLVPSAVIDHRSWLNSALCP